VYAAAATAVAAAAVASFAVRAVASAAVPCVAWHAVAEHRRAALCRRDGEAVPPVKVLAQGSAFSNQLQVLQPVEQAHQWKTSTVATHT
jgi:hypothetical protein